MACECAKRALQHNYTHFGLQFYGECWSGPNAATLYNRDGPSSSCIGTDFKPCSSESLCVGGSLTNYVYSVEKGKI